MAHCFNCVMAIPSLQLKSVTEMISQCGLDVNAFWALLFRVLIKRALKTEVKLQENGWQTRNDEGSTEAYMWRKESL